MTPDPILERLRSFLVNRVHHAIRQDCGRELRELLADVASEYLSRYVNTRGWERHDLECERNEIRARFGVAPKEGT